MKNLFTIYISCIDWIWNKSNVVFNCQFSTEDGFVQLSKIKSRVNIEALIGQQRLIKRWKVFRRWIFQTAMFTTKQKTTTKFNIWVKSSFQNNLFDFSPNLIFAELLMTGKNIPLRLKFRKYPGILSPLKKKVMIGTVRSRATPMLSPFLT